MKIGLIGFFGWGNFGDELFIEAHKAFLSDLGTPVVINDLQKKPYFTRPIDEIVEEYDCFVIGGGDLVIPWSVSELYWKAQYLSKPVFIVGIGVPTWGGYKKEMVIKYREFFGSDSIKLTIARDPESTQWINKHVQPKKEAVFYPDLVCALDMPSVNKGDEKVFGVVLRARRGGGDDFTTVRAACERAKELGYTVRHIVLGGMSTGQADLAVAKDFARDDEDIFYSEDVFEQCKAIGRCSALASMKFHGTVVATMYGIPSFILSATDKSRNFARMIERPDLISSFADAQLDRKLSLNPAPIHSAVRENLQHGARRGYEVLKSAIRQEFKI